MSPSDLIRHARLNAGLTQAELADRVGTTQSAIARLEAEGSNPRIETLARVLRASDRALSLESRPHRPSIDETLVAQMLRLTPGERLLNFDHAYAQTRKIALAGRRARGELV